MGNTAWFKLFYHSSALLGRKEFQAQANYRDISQSQRDLHVKTASKTRLPLINLFELT
jgi:hypothetical protein